MQMCCEAWVQCNFLKVSLALGFRALVGFRVQGFRREQLRTSVCSHTCCLRRKLLRCIDRFGLSSPSFTFPECKQNQTISVEHCCFMYPLRDQSQAWQELAYHQVATRHLDLQPCRLRNPSHVRFPASSKAKVSRAAFTTASCRKTVSGRYLDSQLHHNSYGDNWQGPIE